MGASGQLQIPASVDDLPKQVRGIDQHDVPIFSQDWWIRIARGNSNYRELKVVRGNTIVGELPLVLSKNRFGLVSAHGPHWSPVQGPVVDQRLSRAEQADVLDRLLDQLPRWSSFYLVCNSRASYADLVRDAFLRKGFEHTTHVTYVRYPSDRDAMDVLKSKHRAQIRKAARELDYEEISAGDFRRFLEANLKARGMKSYAPLDTLQRLIEEAVLRGQARVIAARPNRANDTGTYDQLTPYDAAIVYVWDNDRCYYWLSTHRVPSADNSHLKSHPDAVKVLAAKAMQDAQQMNLVFDSDWATTPGMQHLYRNMLGLRSEERRDVFRRATTLGRLHEKFREKLKPMVGHSGSAAAVTGTIALNLLIP